MCLLVWTLMCLPAWSQGSMELAQRYPIIPYPQSLKPSTDSFLLKSGASVFLQGRSTATSSDLELFRQQVKEWAGLSLQSTSHAQGAAIQIRMVHGMPSEGYRLSIHPSGIRLEASSSSGLFYGMQDLLQLLPEGRIHESGVWLPSCDIQDQPNYAYRGMHLDVARHFFSIGYLKTFIDRMSWYHMNELHLHLTDDQGWRIQIKRYPLLTELGAWRTLNNQDSACLKLAQTNPDFKLDSTHLIQRHGKLLYGGFYTQDQIRDLVRYAARRHVNIIPEIDMPGHMMAAIKQYPYLSCQGKASWGSTFSVPISPCKSSTYSFAENVYREIFQLFPSPYVHLGGDEVDTTSWTSCAECRTLMAREGFHSYAQLQGYFIRRMQAFFTRHHKIMIGWDEVLNAGVDTSTVIMYWRGWVPQAPLIAARRGNPVIMAPGNPLYFDQFPDKSSLENVYAFHPVPQGLNAHDAQRILGGEACLWSERIPSEHRMDYMSTPRMCALAEVLWSGHHGFQEFRQRIYRHMERWDQLHIHYRLPDLSGFTGHNAFVDSAFLMVHKPLPGLTVHYTLDGSLPNVHDPVLPDSYPVHQSCHIRLAAFSSSGLRGDVYDVYYRKESYAAAVQPEHLEAGLTCMYFPHFYDSTAMIPETGAAQVFACDSLFVPSSIHAPSFGLHFEGYIHVPQDGIYSFYLTSDDGSRLWLDHRLVVDNDGLHSAQERSGQIALKQGWHRLDLKFLEGGGGYTLRLTWADGTGEPQTLHPQDLARP